MINIHDHVVSGVYTTGNNGSRLETRFKLSGAVELQNGWTEADKNHAAYQFGHSVFAKLYQEVIDRIVSVKELLVDADNKYMACIEAYGLLDALINEIQQTVTVPTTEQGEQETNG